MRFIGLLGTLALAAGLCAQSPAPSPSADEVMEKAIQAAGGREAAGKMTNYVAKGTLEITSMGVSAPTELYSKAPDKRYSLTVVDGYGEIRQGFDGAVGWSSEPQNGLVELKGDMLAQARRDAQFNADLRWKELYPTAEVTGKEKVGEKECWVLKMTPSEGKPVVRYVDAATYLQVKIVAHVYSNEGEFDMPVEFADYRDIGNGVKMPHTIKVVLPSVGELVTRYKEVQFNTEIDDAKFQKPKS